MKQKNGKLIWVVLILAVLAGICYLTTKDFSPQQTTVEKEISAF